MEPNVSSKKAPKNRDAPRSLKVDRAQFEGIVTRLIHSGPIKREDVKVEKKKPHKVIQPSPPHG
jgi:hypothetical protein